MAERSTASAYVLAAVGIALGVGISRVSEMIEAIVLIVLVPLTGIGYSNPLPVLWCTQAVFDALSGATAGAFLRKGLARVGRRRPFRSDLPLVIGSALLWSVLGLVGNQAVNLHSYPVWLTVTARYWAPATAMLVVAAAAVLRAAHAPRGAQSALQEEGPKP